MLSPVVPWRTSTQRFLAYMAYKRSREVNKSVWKNLPFQDFETYCWIQYKYENGTEGM